MNAFLLVWSEAEINFSLKGVSKINKNAPFPTFLKIVNQSRWRRIRFFRCRNKKNSGFLSFCGFRVSAYGAARCGVGVRRLKTRGSSRAYALTQTLLRFHLHICDLIERLLPSLSFVLFCNESLKCDFFLAQRTHCTRSNQAVLNITHSYTLTCFVKWH